MYSVDDVKFFKGTEWSSSIITRLDDIDGLTESLVKLRDKILQDDPDTVDVYTVVLRSLNIFLKNWIWVKSGKDESFDLACESVFSALKSLLLTMRSSNNVMFAEKANMVLYQGNIYCRATVPGCLHRGMIVGLKFWDGIYTTWSKDPLNRLVGGDMEPNMPVQDIDYVVSGSEYGFDLDALGVDDSYGAIIFKAHS